MAGMFATCQPGCEMHLARELAAAGAVVREQGAGWVRGASPATGAPPDLAFAHWLLPAAHELKGGAVNALAQQGFDFFIASLGAERLESAWPCAWDGAGEVPGLRRRAAAVEKAFHVLLRRRLSRVARLAAPDLPRGTGPARGLFVFFTAFNRAWAACEAVLGGQRRMADDPAAPSRSYLKIEEAYGVLGIEPQPGDTVADLGAAPGGWSYSAAKRGARVVAVDRGPLKGGAQRHPFITHRRLDAFHFQPEPGVRYDWLFCDLVEEPHHVLRDLVTPWLGRRWCRRFVINLKFGRTDPVVLLGELRARASPFTAHAAGVHVRHLYHDREELTVVGWL
jgi:23S rRNA (cytidine2498-2'-O)-methyltransferase